MMEEDYTVAHESPRRSWRTLVILILVLVGMAAMGWFFWPSKKDAGQHQKSVVVQTAAALREDVPITLDGLGTIQGYNTVTLHAQVSGRLDKILFAEGQNVHAGDLLAIIDPRTFQAAYDSAVAARDHDMANLENAKRDLMRYENLGEDIARQTLDTARATVAQLEATVRSDTANIESTRAQLSYTRVTAPIDGRTGIRQVDVGNLVQPGDANGIVVITQLQPISVVFSLPQQNLQQINSAINAQGKLSVEALGADGKTIIDSGLLELVDNEIDQTTGSIKLKATFPNKDHMLWPGGFTNVRLLVSTQAGALVIPSVAIQRGPQGTYVYVLQPDKTVKIRQITVGPTQGDNAIIADGITDGEQIVTDGMIKLQDGSKVALVSDQKPDEGTNSNMPLANSGGDQSEQKHRHKDQNDPAKSDQAK